MLIEYRPISKRFPLTVSHLTYFILTDTAEDPRETCVIMDVPMRRRSGTRPRQELLSCPRARGDKTRGLQCFSDLLSLQIKYDVIDY